MEKIKVSAEDVYKALKDDFGFINATGGIKFKIKEFSIVVEQNNVVGNILEEWLARWLDHKGFKNEHNLRQEAPDFWLDPDNKETDWLEIKSFTGSPNFDLSNFMSYINEVLEKPYKLHTKFLLIKYKSEKGIVTIENFWLKNIWEISSPSKSWPVKVQCKKGIIYNLRPSTWYAENPDFKSFASMEHFLAALEETIYKYGETHKLAEKWSSKLIENYKKHYGVTLSIPRWNDTKQQYVGME